MVSPFSCFFIPPIDPFGSISDCVRADLKIRPSLESHTVSLNRDSRRRLDDLEERVEALGAAFWSGVRYGTGIERFNDIFIEIGRPAHYRRIRILARARQLLAETYAHAGHSASAIEQGLISMMLSRVSYQETGDHFDLDQYAKTALIVSQSHLLRQEPSIAAHYLDLHCAARNRTGSPLGGEYFRQRGVVDFQFGPDRDKQARKNFREAMRILAETVEYGRQKEHYEVLNIGTRQMNLLEINWVSAQNLLDYMMKTLAPGEIHISMNVNWTAACGFSTDSPTAHKRATELLEINREASLGFGHQATVAWLLSVTSALPPDLHRPWVRHVLYENTFSNR